MRTPSEAGKCRVACRVVCRVFGATRHGPTLQNQSLKPHLSGMSGYYSRREAGRFRLAPAPLTDLNDV
jgi:hypothetical protein